jgi:hypothetical protein
MICDRCQEPIATVLDVPACRGITAAGGAYASPSRSAVRR